MSFLTSWTRSERNKSKTDLYLRRCRTDAGATGYGDPGERNHTEGKRIYDKVNPFLLCAPSGARFQRVKVPNPPGSGKDIAEGKGVHREVESEGSWMWGTY